MPVTLRPALSADLPSMGRLGALLIRTHHGLDPARFIGASPRTEDSYADYFSGQLGRAEVVLLVAERDGVVVGYTYAGIEGYDYMALRGPAGVLYDIVVDPAEQGQGLGHQLLEATVAELRRRGAPRVVLWTAEGNDAAHRLFARAGFRRTMLEMTRELDGKSFEVES